MAHVPLHTGGLFQDRLHQVHPACLLQLGHHVGNHSTRDLVNEDLTANTGIPCFVFFVFFLDLPCDLSGLLQELQVYTGIKRCIFQRRHHGFGSRMR